jgi:hypothetical protein
MSALEKRRRGQARAHPRAFTDETQQNDAMGKGLMLGDILALSF